MKRSIFLLSIAVVIAIGAAVTFVSCSAPRENEEQATAQKETPEGERSVIIDQGQIGRSGISAKRLQSDVVPDSAVVWLDGKAWIYVDDGEGRFSRLEVSATGSTRQNEEFILKADARQKPVVLVGAQLLLSEEFRSQIDAGEGP